MLNPINHSRTTVEARRYKVEPYVVAADVYSVAPHVGRGGWTWYTGSAAWMYRAGMESVLGINRRGDHLVVDPCMPPAWSGFDAVVTVASTTCTVQVRAVGDDGAIRPHAMLDGVHIAGPQQPARVPLDGHDHLVQVFV
jgi:cyclic beta-1,2-glucan synthetase